MSEADLVEISFPRLTGSTVLSGSREAKKQQLLLSLPIADLLGPASVRSSGRLRRLRYVNQALVVRMRGDLCELAPSPPRSVGHMTATVEVGWACAVNPPSFAAAIPPPYRR
ncbi:hypothetical protein Bbelb_112440 [Branchiostoma belcheri]|nr:hypothetical protein Bbelb_112440 [Branchiostoma belcheri]